METNTTSKGTIIKSVVAIVIVALIGFTLWRNHENKEEDAVSTDTTPITESSSTPIVPTSDTTGTGTVADNKYKDGTYSSDGSYDSPAGEESVSITVTIINDKVASIDFTGNAENPTSRKQQANFASGFDTFVVGKTIDSISLSVVNGSSLTPKGFMDALAKIKTEAQS